MNIIVCLKQILDPEIPVRDFRVDGEKMEAVRGSANLVTNIFCENALETALQLREKLGGRITALTFGAEAAEDTLRKALAMKADAATLVVNDGVPHPDPLAVAQTLAAAIRKIGEFDLVMLGRESGDWRCGGVRISGAGGSRTGPCGAALAISLCARIAELSRNPRAPRSAQKVEENAGPAVL